MNLNELISVIIPTYNCEKFVSYTLDSVINQSYKHIEIIIIDDASTDNTIEILNNFAMKDQRIHLYINERNMGVSFTRNKAISLAKGKWIAFLDSDDLWQKEKLEKQIQVATQKNASFIYTAVKYINEDNKFYKGIFEVSESVTYDQLLRQNIISCSSVLIRTSLIRNYKMENDHTHEDYGCWLKILKNNQVAVGVNEPLLIYRITNNSKSGNKFKSMLMTFRTYRYSGLSYFYSIFYMYFYMKNGLKKYKNIKKT